MRRRLVTAAGALLALAGSVFAVSQHAQAEPAPGFRVADGRLQDANGKDFVLRGVNHAHTWYPSRTGKSLSDIKALGANSVRIVLSTGDRWTKNDAADVSDVVGQCKKNRLVCVLEAHDTTGYGEQSGAVPLSRAVAYWRGVKSALDGQEKYVILNIGNEPHGNTGYEKWPSDTSSAIGELRKAGFRHSLMVDAPNWGQDHSNTMRESAEKVFASDPDKNTVFSVHMYGVYDTAAEVNAYLNRFTERRLPIVVGEFGAQHSDGDPDEDAIMAASQKLGVGYLGWSWSGNNSDLAYLDLATGFDPSRLSPWGERLFNGADGIKETAREASVFGASRSAG